MPPRSLVLGIIALIFGSLSPLAASASITLLHQFTGFPSDGNYPEFGAPVISGSTLYGVTSTGGSSHYGVAYKVNTDGTGYTVIHNFAADTAASPNGRQPFGSLVMSGSTLFGTTTDGGTTAGGTIFKMGTDGGNFGVLHSFGTDPTDGVTPYGALTLSGTTLYGMTNAGGSSPSVGTIFKINVDGTGYTILHDFNAGTSDGGNPYGQLLLSGSTLYGMTHGGGSASNNGTIFKIDTSGSNFSVIHSFVGGSADGSHPQGGLAIAAGTLYAMTTLGGANQGTLFKINTDGSDFGLVHTFTVSPNDGANPSGDVTIVGSTLYGMTNGGGTSGVGTIFQVNTDGTAFNVLHNFTGGVADGKLPFGSLTLNNGTFYGFTERGGNSGDGLGTVFAFTTAGIPGDYNNDDKVDAADYVVWRNNYGSATSLMNDDSSGVGDDDFMRWRSHFGQSAGSGTGLDTTDVPEPASCLLMAFAAVGAALRFRRHSECKTRSIANSPRECKRSFRASSSPSRRRRRYSENSVSLSSRFNSLIHTLRNRTS